MNLKQLSELLGLSQTTVSRALNGYPEVNEATRERVLQAVKETGYRPNKAAQRLATGKAGSIGLVMRRRRVTNPTSISANFWLGSARRPCAMISISSSCRPTRMMR